MIVEKEMYFREGRGQLVLSGRKERILKWFGLERDPQRPPGATPCSAQGQPQLQQCSEPRPA